MKFIDKLKQEILNHSDMYNHYKSENYDLKNRMNFEITHCKKQIEILNNKQNINDKIIESHYYLLNNLLINYDLKPKGILKNIHILCQELLDLCVCICEKNNLNYWLIGGNLLGAVRHGGYIPWDDDMDIGMMRKEFHKFNKVAREDIKINGLENILLLKVFPKNGDLYIHPFTKIDCLTPNDDLLAGIDIFPYDYANSINFTLDDFCNIRPQFLKQSVSYDELMEEYYEKFDLEWDSGNYILPNPSFLRYANRYKKDLCVYDYNSIFPLSKIKFNGKYYNCPNDLEHFLLGEYGDYRNIPRIISDQHFNVDNLKKIAHIDDYFKEYISKLKECNENFK